MIFLDSWVWIEFFSEGSRWKKAEHIVELLQNEKGIVSSTVLMEIRYRFLRKFGKEKADRAIHIIESFENLEIVPVTSGVAKKKPLVPAPVMRTVWMACGVFAPIFPVPLP